MNIEFQQSVVETIKKFALMSAMILTLFPMMSQGKTMKMTADGQLILGRYEHVTIDELGDTQIKAKLDTGAYTASLNASDIEYFKKGDDDWVRFTPVIDDVRLATLELPLEKISKIKPRVEEGEDQDDIVASKRPVVKMKVCLAGQWKTIDVNLTNRDHFNYPLLLGAKALRQYKALVDAGREYTADPACDE